MVYFLVALVEIGNITLSNFRKIIQPLLKIYRIETVR
jgi:hypothetical protein